MRTWVCNRGGFAFVTLDGSFFCEEENLVLVRKQKDRQAALVRYYNFLGLEYKRSSFFGGSEPFFI